ncbi:AraC family transcriptional regulator [Vibrio maerlii]|uniref:AraC family transcriptional regulator n=1 Tax=Vibrio maerlii TaxID=2231648 RepID=UPI000E3E938C|nr:AraC family transcriptional regulator [Vibrio maerlii]
MKAQFEKVEYDKDSSWQLLIRRLEEIPFEWHFHPEFELTLTLNSVGERYIGGTVSEYADLDLVLLGPNIPHTWQSRVSVNQQKRQKVYVLWFDMQWLDDVTRLFPECKPIKPMMQLAMRGLHFSPQVAKDILPLFLQLDEACAAKRLALLLQILDKLRQQLDAEPILAEQAQYSLDNDKREQRLLGSLLERIHAGYTQSIMLSDLAELVGMSESTLRRFFRKTMGQSVSHYITQVRLGKACSLLIQSDKPIALIAEMSGFSNLSNFNRLFLKYKQMKPKEFRTKFERAY